MIYISTFDPHGLDLLDDLELLVVLHLNKLLVSGKINKKWIDCYNTFQKIYDMMGIRAMQTEKIGGAQCYRLLDIPK